MIESHKLLQPYLDIQDLAVVDLTGSKVDTKSGLNTDVSFRASSSGEDMWFWAFITECLCCMIKRMSNR